MRLLVPLLALLAALPAAAQRQEPAYSLDIEGVRILSQRKLSQIGVQRTSLDSTALHESVSASLGDVLSQRSTLFVKSYGRGTMATVSLRGTAPSHTQVTWNGMKLNSPMLGMVDFSQIPSYFIDDAGILHGASSVTAGGGGLGGAVILTTRPVQERGLSLRFVQGVSSYGTWDEFLRLGYGGERWRASTRVAYATSENDFPYTNYNKKHFVKDEQGNVVGSFYPRERNRNGEVRNLHLMQELYRTWGANRFALSGWYMHSRRGVPMIVVDYRDENRSRNEQHEETFRGVASWERLGGGLKLSARAGYTYSDMLYRYRGDVGDGTMAELTHSQSYIHSLFGDVRAEWYVGRRWLLTAGAAAYQHLVQSKDRSVEDRQGDERIVGYDKARFELSGFLSLRWSPWERLGLGANLRGEMSGQKWAPLIPALFADYTLSRRGEVVLKASVARNYRFPTLNDLYFQPGGNPDLRPERGMAWDAGVRFRTAAGRCALSGEATFFDSHIDDWILWLSTRKGFWTPVNVKRVHSYGVELKAALSMAWGRAWSLELDGHYALNRSINHGDPMNWADESIGKQLVYVPVHLAGVNGRLAWRSWTLRYQWTWYSERYVTSSNATQSHFGVVEPYFMSDLSIEKRFAPRWARISLKFKVCNLFDEEYQSVLSHPMPGRNYGFYLDISPRWRGGRGR